MTTPPTDPTDSRFTYSADCGTNEMGTTASQATTVNQIIGNNEPYGSAAACPNASSNSEFFQYAGYSGANSEGWQSYWCTGMRTSLDSQTKVKGYEIGGEITYMAGYKLFSTQQSATPTILSEGTS